MILNSYNQKIKKLIMITNIKRNIQVCIKIQLLEFIEELYSEKLMILNENRHQKRIIGYYLKIQLKLFR